MQLGVMAEMIASTSCLFQASANTSRKSKSTSLVFFAKVSIGYPPAEHDKSSYARLPPSPTILPFVPRQLGPRCPPHCPRDPRQKPPSTSRREVLHPSFAD